MPNSPNTLARGCHPCGDSRCCCATTSIMLTISSRRALPSCTCTGTALGRQRVSMLTCAPLLCASSYTIDARPGPGGSCWAACCLTSPRHSVTPTPPLTCGRLSLPCPLVSAPCWCCVTTATWTSSTLLKHSAAL